MSTVKGSNKRKDVARRQEELQVKGQLDVLPDDVLLEVFKFYLDEHCWDLRAWHMLVHVCRRWRQVVFASPRWLNLRLLCTNKTPVKELLDIWPALPIVVKDDGTSLGLRDTTNIDAALEYNDRVCKITIHAAPNPLLEKVASIKEPFLAPTDLELCAYANRAPVFPDSFLDGSAPHLRNLTLQSIPFPGLHKLLLSAHQLVHLHLYDIPDSAYISPEVMVTCLSLLPSLEGLTLHFLSPRYQTNQHLLPLTRTVLPSLTSVCFYDASKYLEYIVTRFDLPHLAKVQIAFYDEQIFDARILRNFISRLEAFKAFHQAYIDFSYDNVDVSLTERAYYSELWLRISRKPSDRQLSSLTQVFNSSLPPLPTMEYLYICEGLCTPGWEDDVEETQWLELLHPFVTVKSLYLEKELAPCIAPALQELARGRVTSVLPALQKIFVQGPVYQGIVQFIAMRQLLGHPVAIWDWDGMRPDEP